MFDTDRGTQPFVAHCRVAQSIPERDLQCLVFANESARLDSLESALIAVPRGGPHKSLIGIRADIRAERDVENGGDHADHWIIAESLWSPVPWVRRCRVRPSAKHPFGAVPVGLVNLHMRSD